MDPVGCMRMQLRGMVRLELPCVPTSICVQHLASIPVGHALSTSSATFISTVHRSSHRHTDYLRQHLDSQQTCQTTNRPIFSPDLQDLISHCFLFVCRHVENLGGTQRSGVVRSGGYCLVRFGGNPGLANIVAYALVVYPTVASKIYTWCYCCTGRNP